MLGRTTPLGRSTPTLVRRDSHRVEDLAFDNLRLARRAAALEAQLERASLASSSSWGGWLGYGPEPTQLATVLDDELAAKAHENEQLHIAIYEQAKDLTKQQRTEAAQRWAALAALRGSLAELANDSSELVDVEDQGGHALSSVGGCSGRRHRSEVPARLQK